MAITKIQSPFGPHRFQEIITLTRHPSGIEAILNLKALQSCQSLDSNLYRCIKLLNFEVAPVIDLQVTSTAGECLVEMISCKIYTHPFAMLPPSTVEGPGNIMMQALVDQLVPLLLQQLLQDYEERVSEQRKSKSKTLH
ncbi:uncharacterized protein LOC121771516 isoform X4 [Salvia splendens]|uniref:uncharacterized protein LOC121771516 isoform X4 n=1 Tax=Salvia splendens TaxID=180675 RepID=UPI001C27C0A1|nr:uncharacterized protein LOC121771516 isoform X4 [Salvia splendens]